MRVPFRGCPISTRSAGALAVAVLCGVLPVPGPALAEDGGRVPAAAVPGPAVPGPEGPAQAAAGAGADVHGPGTPGETATLAEGPAGSVTGGAYPFDRSLPGPALTGPEPTGQALSARPGSGGHAHRPAGPGATGAGRVAAAPAAPEPAVGGPAAVVPGMPGRAAPAPGTRAGAEVLRLSEWLARAEWRYGQDRTQARARRVAVERLERQLRRERRTEARLRRAAGRLARAQYRSGVLPNALRSLNAFDSASLEQAVRDRSLVSTLRRVHADNERLARRVHAEAMASRTLTSRLQRLGADRSDTERRLVGAREELRRAADRAASAGRCLVLSEAQRKAAVATPPALPERVAPAGPDAPALTGGRGGRDGGTDGTGRPGAGGGPAGSPAPGTEAGPGPLAAPPMPGTPVREMLPGVSLPGVAVPGAGMAVPLADRSGILLPGDVARRGGPAVPERGDGAAARVPAAAGTAAAAPPMTMAETGAGVGGHRAAGAAGAAGAVEPGVPGGGPDGRAGAGADGGTDGGTDGKNTEHTTNTGHATNTGHTGHTGSLGDAGRAGAGYPGGGDRTVTGGPAGQLPGRDAPGTGGGTPGPLPGTPLALHGPGPDLDFGVRPRTGARPDAAPEADGGSGAGGLGTWTLPLVSYELSAGFGSAGSRWSHGHTGQDFAVPVGTPVRSVGAGEVVSLGCGGPFGMSMVVRHPNGVHTQYAHLSTILAGEGDRVRTGERIALSGDTGNSTGPHLHFEVRRTPEFGSGMDPVRWLGEHGVQLRPGVRSH